MGKDTCAWCKRDVLDEIKQYRGNVPPWGSFALRKPAIGNANYAGIFRLNWVDQKINK